MTNTRSYTIQSFYDAYYDGIKDNPLYIIDYTTYRKIITEYFLYIRDRIIEEGIEFKLPCRLGTVYIVKHKPKNWNGKSLRVDFQATKEYGKTIYHLNEHSNGYKFRFFWSKKDVLLTNRSKYQLIATRTNKRHLAQIIKTNQRDYITV